MIQYTRGQLSDYPDLLDFGNYVFKIDFKELLPKLYDNRPHLAPYHFITKEDDRIKAMVGAFPLDLNVANTSLKGFGIGTVSVHPYSRGKGYMKQLMKNALDFMIDEQADFAVLSGQRQRYEYFGFTPTGCHMCFNIDKVNLIHKGFTHIEEFTLQPFTQISSTDLAKIHGWHHHKTLHSTRPLQDFIDICKSWEATPYAVYIKGDLKGYFILCGTSILDFYLEDINLLGHALYFLMHECNKTVLEMTAGLHMPQVLSLLLSFAENYRLTTSTHLQIFNYQKFIQSFLELKASYDTLIEGTLTIEIQNYTTLSIEVTDKIDVRPTTQTPDISLSHLEATHFLCDPIRFIPPTLTHKAALIHSWFPLPFSFCQVDNM